MSKMNELQKYVQENTERGACQCGQCVDGVAHPELHQPKGHTANLIFFQVAAKPTANAATFKALIKESQGGENGMDVDLFDGEEHNYLELGAWIGDQGLAMMFMGLGAVLGLWKLLTPLMLGLDVDDPLVKQMAGMGFISVQATKE